ncbi:MAG: hypothetical protein LBV69_05130 [Bacteroidales bacterium]|jgi:hypothetical protein|nr:hypothetical protein [Bacteroidales bacterium]
MSYKEQILIINIFMIYYLLPTTSQAENISLQEKYNLYRNRLLSEWIIISSNVEQFGTNIPAMDRYLDKSGEVYSVGWSDGNANFNHWLGFLATEYKLLKINNQDCSETLKMLLYSMFAIERLDLYSEYLLRRYHNIKENENCKEAGFVNYPNDINGALLRDDVTLGFWKQYHSAFKCNYGNLTKTKDGTSTFTSVFQKGKIPRQTMSQDNICYMLQSLALIKKFVGIENISKIEINFENNYIPEYLKSKKIWNNDIIDFGLWVDDITNRLLSNISHHYPEQKIVLKCKNKLRARPSKTNFGKILASYWYIKNPITNDLVAEGNGEDMGVFLNSYGFAEVADFITNQKIHHTDNSDKGLAKYLFKAILFKNLRVLYSAGIPLPEKIDDYMIRALASVADINQKKNSTELLYLLRDKRDNFPYEHYPLILTILHNEKYNKIYNPQTNIYQEDYQYYTDLLNQAPVSFPHSDTTSTDYNRNWSTTSRLVWPFKNNNNNLEFSGLDFLFLHNLFCIIFVEKNFYIKTEENIKFAKKNKQYQKPEMKELDIEYLYKPIKINQPIEKFLN